MTSRPKSSATTHPPLAEVIRAGAVSMHDIVDRAYLAKLSEADPAWYRRNMALAREKHQ